MMGGSIEGRMPFMDVELARVVARFPDRFLINHPKGKAVLRVALSRLLPREILTRKKVGFRVPLNNWFRGPYRDLVGDLLESGASETRRHLLMLPPWLRQRAPRCEQNHERVLWMLANLELFLRTFKPRMASKA